MKFKDIFNFFHRNKIEDDNHIVRMKLKNFIIDDVEFYPDVEAAQIFLSSGAIITATGTLLKPHNGLKKGNFIKTPIIQKILDEEEGEIILKTKNNCFIVIR